MATQDKLVNLADLKVAYDRILSAIAPTYTEGASYTSGNYVIYKGELYRCKAAVTDAAATIDTTNYFTKCTTAGQVETAIKDIAPAYSASSTYTIGKYVSYDRNIYRCKQDIETAGTALPTNTTYWTQVTTGLNDLADRIDAETAARTAADSELKSAFDANDIGNKHGTNVLVEQGYFTNGYKAIDDKTVGLRYYNYDAVNNEFVFKYTGSATGSQTVSCALSDSGLASADAIVPIETYPVALLHVETNVPAGANLYFRVFLYQSNGTTLSHNYDVPISTGQSDYIINIAEKIASMGWANDVYYKINNYTSDSYTYTEKPYVYATHYGFFTQAQIAKYNLALKYANLNTRLTSAEEVTAKAITDIGESNIINESDLEYCFLNTSGQTETGNVVALPITTDFIKVKTGQEYVLQIWTNKGEAHEEVQSNVRICEYNSSKTFVQRKDNRNKFVTVDGKAYWLLKLTYESGTDYIRICCAETYGYHKFKLEKGNAVTDWTPGSKDIINSRTWNGTMNHSIFGIIHRGCGENQTAPENTIPGFIWGAKAGFKFCETDIRYTSDGIAVLLHDASINRTARNADGTEISGTVNIASITYEQALTYDFGIFMGQEYAGTKIPTLEELIILAKNIGLHPFLELKGFIDPEQDIPNIIKMLKSYGMLNHVSWISGVYPQLFIVRRYDPNAHLCILTSDSTFDRDLEAAKALKTSSNEVSISILTDFITTARKEAMFDAGITCTAYCPNTEQAMLAIDQFVSSVTSDTLNYETVRKNSILGD